MKRSVAVGALMVGACTAAGGRMAEVIDDGGKLLRDAGALLRDAGAAISDAGRGQRDSAQAQAPGGDGDTETSGSRLKARYTTTTTTGADGSLREQRYFAGWYDSQRNEQCSEGFASDGKTRCLPTVATGSAGYFADAACSKPLASVSKLAACGGFAPAPPKYLQLATASAAGCPGVRITPATKVAVTALFAKSSAGACAMEGSPDFYLATFDFYDAALAEVPAAAFVELSVSSTTTMM